MTPGSPEHPALAGVRAARADLDAATAALAAAAVEAVRARAEQKDVARAAGRSREWVRLAVRAADETRATWSRTPEIIDGE